MNAIAEGLLISAIIFSGSIAGFRLHRLLPTRHLSSETLDAIKLGTGMLSVLASLVLGLLIATVKTSFDATNTEVRSYAADLIVLDETLRDYGEAALPARRLLRDYTSRLLRDVWIEGDHPYLVENRQAGAELEHVRDEIRGLNAADQNEQWLRSQALQIATGTLRQRWLLIEQAGPSVHPVVIALLVSWITATFMSFGINAPQHSTMYVAFLIVSLAIGSAIFIVNEMDTPFEGVLRVSPQPIRTALEHMLPPGK